MKNLSSHVNAVCPSALKGWTLHNSIFTQRDRSGSFGSFHIFTRLILAKVHCTN